MKTFKDIEMKNRVDGMDGKHGLLFFDNGYGVSVINGSMFYTSNDTPFELAVIKGTKKDWLIDYDHPESKGDVRGYLTETNVDEIMKSIQETKTGE